jgi:hypothetical protein
MINILDANADLQYAIALASVLNTKYSLVGYNVELITMLILSGKGLQFIDSKVLRPMMTM